MLSSLTLLACLALGAEPSADGDAKARPLFAESFDDDRLEDRSWYDLGKTRVVGDAFAGKGCLEYEWTDAQSGAKGSSPARRLFEPTERVYVRYYLKLSKGWGWSGRNYHPHMTHFLTTENGKWHGRSWIGITGISSSGQWNMPSVRFSSRGSVPASRRRRAPVPGRAAAHGCGPG
jgi:hypothetical protein